MKNPPGSSTLVDALAALADSPNTQIYLRVLIKLLIAEVNETVTNCNALKLLAAGGKMRFTDVPMRDNR